MTTIGKDGRRRVQTTIIKADGKIGTREQWGVERQEAQVSLGTSMQAASFGSDDEMETPVADVREDGYSHLPTDEPLLAKTAKRIEKGLPGYSAEPTPGKQYESWTGQSVRVVDGRPLNPSQKTGKTGLGSCSFWGPNHAADPIVTRDGRNGSTEILLIKRGDTGEWALPGGKLDEDETAGTAASRELKEEAGIDVGFDEANTAYKGYVDDPRNTDNAWFETTAIHAHLTGDAAKQEPKGGDDADEARWVKLTPEVRSNLYADHAKMVDRALQPDDHLGDDPTHGGMQVGPAPWVSRGDAKRAGWSKEERREKNQRKTRLGAMMNTNWKAEGDGGYNNM